jgi:predicted dehydrogenase
MKAGKDVYCEKPLTLTIDDGKKIVKTWKATKSVFQTGSQQRSESQFRLACELVRNGRVGKLQTVEVHLPTGPTDGPFEVKPVPPDFDWDMWLGPARLTDYVRERTHGSFRWWLEYSGGMMTDWGAHHNDIAQWGNGSELSGPAEIEGRSLVEMIPGGYDAASEYEIQCKYSNGVTMTITDEKRAPNGVKFIGSDGWVFVTRGKIDASNKALLEEKLPENAIRLHRSDNHMGNFFECVKSRKDPICPVEVGHRSISVAHLGAIAVRTGLRLQWDPAKEIFVGETAKEANMWVSRDMRKPYDYSYLG